MQRFFCLGIFSVFVFLIGCAAPQKYCPPPQTLSSTASASVTNTPNMTSGASQSQPSYSPYPGGATGAPASFGQGIRWQPMNNISKGYTYAGKLCWNPCGYWEKQVVGYNGINQPPANHPVISYVNSLTAPSWSGREPWEPLYYQMFDQSGNKFPTCGSGAYYQTGQSTMMAQAPPQTTYVAQPPSSQTTIIEGQKPSDTIVIVEQGTTGKKKVHAGYMAKLAQLGFTGSCAITRFQAKYGLKQDGSLGPKTKAAINAAVIAKTDP